jgi:hypothetical protein
VAATDKPSGHARDALWESANDESGFDGTQALLAENPALQASAIKTLVNMLTLGGSLSTTVGGLEMSARGGSVGSESPRVF